MFFYGFSDELAKLAKAPLINLLRASRAKGLSPIKRRMMQKYFDAEAKGGMSRAMLQEVGDPAVLKHKAKLLESIRRSKAKRKLIKKQMSSRDVKYMMDYPMTYRP